MADTNTDSIKEILTRSRRTETRLTSLIIQMGLDARGQKPEFERPRDDSYARVCLPSRDCSMRSILAAVPKGFRGMVDVMIGDDCVTTLVIRDRT